MGSFTRGLKSDKVMLLAIFFAFVLTFGGVSHNAFGNSVPWSSGLVYIIIVLIDLGGFIGGKILVNAVSGAFAGTVLYDIVKIGGGFVAYAIASYFWFALLYSYFGKDKNRRKVKNKLKALSNN